MGHYDYFGYNPVDYDPSDGYDRDEDEVTEKVATRTRVRVARKARGNIRTGDLIQVTDGFTYEVGGGRTGYLRQTSAVLVSADGSWVHPWYAVVVRECYNHRLNAVQRTAVEAVIAAQAEAARLEREAARLTREAHQARIALRAAKAGDKVDVDGRAFEVLDLSHTENFARVRDAETGEVRTFRI
jgi:hypothetical protein